jgi:FkbM family methyltransferase
MKVGHVLRNLKLVERNREWLSAPVPLPLKVGYYGEVARSTARTLLGRPREITYLGRRFVYDNPATPLNLQTYPHEVADRILGAMDVEPARILDVGANLGQFACTASYFLPGAEIDSLEPNPEVFALLSANATAQMRVFNVALATGDGPETFYYEPGRSGIGSFLRENAGEQDHVREVQVAVARDASLVTGHQRYDLVKIDVEGFEREAIEALGSISTQYLAIEVSGRGRARNYSDAQLFAAITGALGDFDVVRASGVAPSAPTYELLLRFR